MRSLSSPGRMLKVFALYALALPVLVACASCGSSRTSDSNQQYGVVVINAPAAGVVRRVLVNEGTQINAGAPIVEIAIEEQLPAAIPSPGESAESQAARRVTASGAEIDAARTEVVQHEAEVTRLTPLVASGEASQAQLDGERALYDRAQQRLQKAQEAEKQAQTGLLAARQPGVQRGATAQPPTSPRERIVIATASSAGTVSVVSARVGDRVTSGQPLATLRTDGR